MVISWFAHQLDKAVTRLELAMCDQIWFTKSCSMWSHCAPSMSYWASAQLLTCMQDREFEQVSRGKRSQVECLDNEYTCS